MQTSERYDLMPDFLRCEWGFDGMVMTDRIVEMKAEMNQTETELFAESESAGSEALNAAMAKMEQRKMDAFNENGLTAGSSAEAEP